MPLLEEKASILRELGQEIKARREELGISFNDVYQKTRIHPSYLEALENADYEILPATVYTLGFIRTYLGVLKFDELYPEFRHRLLKNMRIHGKDTRETNYAPPSSGFKLASRFWIFMVLLLIISGAITYVTYSWNKNGIPNITLRNGQMPERTNQSSAIISSDIDEEAKSNDVSENVGANIPEPEPRKPELQIIAAHDDCWISIRVGNGRIVDRTLRKGETFTMELTEMTRVSYGRPWAVTVVHNGRDIGMPYKSGPRRPQVNLYYPDGRSGRLEANQQANQP